MTPLEPQSNPAATASDIQTHLAWLRTRMALRIGLVLIGAGSLTTAIVTWEYRSATKHLDYSAFRAGDGIPAIGREPPDVAVWMAVLVCLIGVVSFVLVMMTVDLE